MVSLTGHQGLIKTSADAPLQLQLIYHLKLSLLSASEAVWAKSRLFCGARWPLNAPDVISVCGVRRLGAFLLLVITLPLR